MIFLYTCVYIYMYMYILLPNLLGVGENWPLGGGGGGIAI